MNIILVVDHLEWAFGHVAKNIKSKINDSNVEILCTSNYKDVKDFLSTLDKHTSKNCIIHFFWRDYLLEVLDLARLHKKYKNIFINNKITTHIPDHLFIDDDYNGYAKRVDLMRFVDGYFVTSRKLYEIYSRQNDFSSPYGVIYDNPYIPFEYKENSKVSKELDVVWIGNSKWGEYLGYLDYKGLNSVVLPALKKFEQTGRTLNYHEFDSAKGKHSHEDILKALRNSDVLLVSSVAEGTPLPLLEAMANGCAIITTDVGIADEIIPQEQKEFIVERNSDAFYKALLKLDTDRGLLKKLQQLNNQNYKCKFVDSNEISLSWQHFFEKVIASHNDNYKEKFLNSVKIGVYRRFMSMALYHTSRVAVKLNLHNVLKKSNLVKSFYYKLSRQTVDKVDYSILDDFYKSNIAGKEIIALYSPYWSGVATSTVSFFKEHSLKFPYHTYEFPQVKEHAYLEKIVELLSQSQELKSLVMSGGTTLQIQLAKALKKKNDTIKIYFGWHGSPAQWVDASQYSTFSDWHNLYSENIIDGVISFKPGLSIILNEFNIKSYSVSNYIIDSPLTNMLPNPSESHYSIGLFAAMFSWYKNPFPQLLAIGSIEGGELVTNLTLDNNMQWIIQKIKMVQLNGNLSNKRFVELLSNLHVVSYVTNTECSPMIALESASVGTPCIVGPAGNIYKGSEKLEYYLVEPEVDNPQAIRERLILVRNNYEEIKSLLKIFVESYNIKLDEVKKALYKELK